MLRIIIILGMSCFFISCNNKPAEKPSPIQQAPPPVQEVKSEQLYPSVDIATIQHLWENCTGVDYIYYDMNFSMNRTQQNDIRNSLTHIAQQPALIRSDCKPLGRIMFKDDSGIKLEADMFYSKNCSYFIFMENNKPKYANYMTDNGIKFFDNIFKRMKVEIK